VQPRFVTHVDDGAITAATALCREVLPAGGDILDLMSSWVSHLPPEMAFRSVTGHGMNATQLAANPRLTARLVQDLNVNPALPFADGALLCVSVQYLQRPVEVFRELRRCCGRARRPWCRSPTAASRPGGGDLDGAGRPGPAEACGGIHAAGWVRRGNRTGGDTTAWQCLL
jgi:hypothetical protein